MKKDEEINLRPLFFIFNLCLISCSTDNVMSTSPPSLPPPPLWQMFLFTQLTAGLCDVIPRYMMSFYQKQCNSTLRDVIVRYMVSFYNKLCNSTLHDVILSFIVSFYAKQCNSWRHTKLHSVILSTIPNVIIPSWRHSKLLDVILHYVALQIIHYLPTFYFTVNQ